MLMSYSLYENMSSSDVVACVPVFERNYSGIASVHEVVDGIIQGDRAQLDNACLFPASMLREAMQPDGSAWLEGGDWGIWNLPEGIIPQSDYFSFTVRLYGEH